MRALLAVCLLFVLPLSAWAHFIWLAPHPDDPDGKVVVYFADKLGPDKPELLKSIAHTKLVCRSADGKDAALKIAPTGKEDEDRYVVAVPGKGARIVGGHCVWGVHVLKELDEKTPFLLHYHPKAVLGDLAGLKADRPKDAPKAEIVPSLDGDTLRVRVMYDGKPAARTAVTFVIPGEEKVGFYKTDRDGEYALKTKRGGTYAMWTLAGTEKTAGEHAGKKYDEVRHYATLTVAVPEPKKE